MKIKDILIWCLLLTALGLALHVAIMSFEVTIYKGKLAETREELLSTREELTLTMRELLAYDQVTLPWETVRIASYEIMVEYTSLNYDQANDVSDAFMDVLSSTTVKHKNLMPWVLAIMIKESGCRVEAQHEVSSARGIGQIIYRYHTYLQDYGISKKDLTSDTRSSILAVYLVLERYWIQNSFSYKEAVFAYRGRRYEADYRDIADMVAMYGCKLFK